MKNPFSDFDDKAVQPFQEPLRWTQDKQPHQSATFDGVVLQGMMESQNAGVRAAPLVADIYTVHVSRKSVIVDQMVVGDTIERGCWTSTVLNVQQVFKDESGYWIYCTAEERAPL